MQFANSGNLQLEIDMRMREQNHFSEPEILTYFTHICLALRCVHAKNIIHRDIKGANVLMHSENRFKICLLSDFGVGKVMGSATDFAET